MEYTYFPSGVCSKKIDIELEGDIVKNVRFHGGCNGNLKAISKLVQGMSVEDVSEKLEGNTCGLRATSCADQLVQGLREALAQEKQDRAADGGKAPNGSVDSDVAADSDNPENAEPPEK